MEILEQIIRILFIVVPFIGIILSIRHRFSLGSTAFTLILISDLIIKVSNGYVERISLGEAVGPTHMSIGYLILLSSLLSKIILLIGYIILIIGLYQLLNQKGK